MKPTTTTKSVSKKPRYRVVTKYRGGPKVYHQTRPVFGEVQTTRRAKLAHYHVTRQQGIRDVNDMYSWVEGVEQISQSVHYLELVG